MLRQSSDFSVHYHALKFILTRHQTWQSTLDSFNSIEYMVGRAAPAIYRCVCVCDEVQHSQPHPTRHHIDRSQLPATMDPRHAVRPSPFLSLSLSLSLCVCMCVCVCVYVCACVCVCVCRSCHRRVGVLQTAINSHTGLEPEELLPAVRGVINLFGPDPHDTTRYGRGTRTHTHTHTLSWMTLDGTADRCFRVCTREGSVFYFESTQRWSPICFHTHTHRYSLIQRMLQDLELTAMLSTLLSHFSHPLKVCVCVCVCVCVFDLMKC